MRRHHFLGNLGEEAPFFNEWIWEEVDGVFFEGGPLFIYAQNYAGGWLEFHFMAHALPGGLVI